MIKLFDKDTRDFTTLGIGVLKDAISCEVAEKINADFEVEMEYPITGQLFNEIRNLRILYLKPNDYTNEQPFRIYSITKPIDGVVTINAQHVSYDLSGYLFCPKQNELGEYPIYTKAEDFFNALNTEIQNGNVYPNTCPFRFECSIKEETEGIQISEITNLRKILTSVAEAFEGEYEFDGFTVRMKSKRGAYRGFSVTYSKNMVDLEATVNSQGSATGIFPYFKSEETKTVQGISRTWVKMYIAQNGEYPNANWLTDKPEKQEAVTPVINTQAYMIALRPDDPDSYKQYDGHIVIWRTTINNSYVIAGFTPDENGNYPSNALSAEKDSDISISPVNKHYYRTVSNSVYTYYKFDSTTNKYIKQNNEGEYEDITSQKPVFCFVNQNPTKDSSGETVLDEHYLVDDFGRELSPAAGEDYMTSLNEMLGIMNHFYYWTTTDFDNAKQLWVMDGNEKDQNGNYKSDALTDDVSAQTEYEPEDGNWYKISIDSSYEYYRYSSEEGFYMRQTGTGRYHEYPKDTTFEAAPTMIGTMSETKTLEHYVDLPEKIIYANGLENDRYQKIVQVDLTEYLNDKLATRVGSTVYEYDKVTINANSVMYSSEWLDVGGTPELDFIAQQITTTDKTDENGKNFYGRLFCWNGSNYYEVYGLPRTYLVANPEAADSNGNYNYNQFSTEVNGTPLDPRAGFYYKLLQGSTYIYYEYNTSIIRWEFKANAAGFYRHVADSDEYISVYVEGKSTYYSDSETYYVKDGSSYVATTELAENLETYCEQRGMFEKCKNTDGTPKNPSQFSESEALCVDGEGKSYVEPRRKRILNSAEPSEQELRDAAVEYLEKNDVNVANNTFTVTFAKLSRSPEYSKWKELEHVELGDSISIIYSDLGVVQHEIEVVGLAYDVVNDKYTQVELGNVATSLADTAVTSSDGVSVLKNDKGYTDVKKVADIIAENITANYIKAMTAEFTEAQIQQLEATRLDITEALTASQASIDEIVSNLLIADDAVIKNTLTSGEISVKGDISIESGEINLGIIAQFKETAANIYFKNGENYIPVYRTVIDPETEQPVLIREYYNPNITYYVDDGEHPMFTEEKASNIGVKYGDSYQSVVGTFWEENRIYYKNLGTVESPNWQQETITSENVGNYTDLATKYVSVDVEEHLEDYTDTNKGYRFNVENTGAMLIQNNNGIKLLEFNDGTGSLILYGDIQSHRVIADDTLIVGSDDIESASMYYNPTDGLKIVDGEINLNDLFRVDRDGNLYVGGTTTANANMYYNPTDGLVFKDGNINMGGNFTVNDDGEVLIKDGTIQLGEIRNSYSAVPVVTATCLPLDDIIYTINVNAHYENQAILPEYERFDFTLSVSGYNLPPNFRANFDGSLYVNGEDSGYFWVDAVLDLYDGQDAFLNTTGHALAFDVEIMWSYEDDNGNTWDGYYEKTLYVQEHESNAILYEATDTPCNDYYTLLPGDIFQLADEEQYTPERITFSKSSSVTIAARYNSANISIPVDTTLYDANGSTMTFTCPKSGIQIDYINHIDGYKFEVNTDGEMKAASGIIYAKTDELTIASNKFIANYDEIIIGGSNENSPKLSISDENIVFYNGIVDFQNGLHSASVSSDSDISAPKIIADEKLTLGKVTATYQDVDADDIDISLDDVVVFADKGTFSRGIVATIIDPSKPNVIQLSFAGRFETKVDNREYVTLPFDYSYTCVVSVTLGIRFKMTPIPPMTAYRFRSRAANLYELYEIYPGSGVYIYSPVYNSDKDTYFEDGKQYYEYDSVQKDYEPVTMDDEKIEYYCIDDTYRSHNWTMDNIVVKVTVPANTSGDKYPRFPEKGYCNYIIDLNDANMPKTHVPDLNNVYFVEGSVAFATDDDGNPKYPSFPNGKNSVKLNDVIIVPENESDIDIGADNARISHSYHKTIDSLKYRFVYNSISYQLAPVYIHHIIITPVESSVPSVYLNYRTSSRYTSFASFSDFIDHILLCDTDESDIAWFTTWRNKYQIDPKSSLYYTGYQRDDRFWMLDMKCILFDKPDAAIRYCNVGCSESTTSLVYEWGRWFGVHYGNGNSLYYGYNDMTHADPCPSGIHLNTVRSFVDNVSVDGSIDDVEDKYIGPFVPTP